MKYLGRPDLFTCFEIIKKVPYAKEEQNPEYEADAAGIEQALGVMERIKEPYYGDLYEKAAYLFLSVCSGHFFLNGNKRLAVALVICFFVFNKRTFPERRKNDGWDKILEDIFPEAKFRGNEDLTFWQSPIFKIACLCADSNSHPYSFDELKERIALFFKQFFSEHFNPDKAL